MNKGTIRPPSQYRPLMGVSFKKNKVKVLPYRITIWSVIVLIFLFYSIQNHPMTLDDSLRLSEGVEITRDGDADVLIVLDYEAIRDSGPTFSERDFSAAWINLVQRELGPVAVATPETLSPRRINTSRILVLTSSVSAEMPQALLERARQHALDGGLVVVERPDGEARRLFSADGAAGPRQGRKITHARGMVEPFSDELEQMPLFVDYVGSTAPRDGATTLLAIDGAPAIYATPFGDGYVVTVDFDLSRQLVALQQGLPAEDFTLPRGRQTSSAAVRTADLVAHQDLLGADAPYADLLGRFIVYGIFMRYAAVPGFWIYPDAADGAVIFIHEDSTLGDGGAWKLDYERQQGARSTLYTTMDAGLSPEGSEAIGLKGGQLGFAWHYGDISNTLFEPVGFFGYYPFRRPLGLRDQLDALRDGADLETLRTSRTVDGQWSQQWSAPLAALANAGMRTDTSYEVPTHRGYAFGTGLPFLAMTEEGIPLSIRQYPVIVPDDAKEGPPLAEILERSAQGHHQLVTISSKPSRYGDYPDLDHFEEWLETFDQAREQGHLMLNIEHFEAYQRMRRAGSIRSRLDRHTSLPEGLRSADTAPDHRAALVRITAEVHQRNIYLIVPAYIGGASFFGAISGQERVGDDIVTHEVDTEEASMMGFPIRRFRLEQGFNQFEFYYR